MSVQACLLFLAGAFYLGFFAQTLKEKASVVVIRNDAKKQN